jgi:hypothetical protein
MALLTAGLLARKNPAGPQSNLLAGESDIRIEGYLKASVI